MATETEKETPKPPSPATGIGEEHAEYDSTPDREPPQLSAEGPLREALIRLWEQARDRNLASISELNIRLFDASDTFPLLSVAGRIVAAEKKVVLSGGYETTAGGTCELEFAGAVEDAQPVREFLEPQLRAASTTQLEASFTLTFPAGLAMQEQAPEQLTEQLCRYANGAAFVSATARAAA